MTNKQFIEKIAPIVQKMAKKYNFGVPSAIIAQACLESAYGTSLKAKYHNYFGLKYRPNRISITSNSITDGSSEQLSNGSYVKIATKWFAFNNMTDGVEGYFQFIKTGPYKVQGITDPETYLQALKSAGYATSQKYVSNLMSVIKKWNLTQYDASQSVSSVAKQEAVKVNIKQMISAYNFEGRNGQGIKYIVLHYTGNKTDTAWANANYFRGGNRGASAHYFVDDKNIYQSVLDTYAAWHVGKNYGANNLYGICTNKNSIGIEMCSKNGAIPEATIKNAAELTKYLMNKYGIPAERVVTHYLTCSKRCPGWYGWNPTTGSTAKWDYFKTLITQGTASTKKTTSKKAGSSSKKTTTKKTTTNNTPTTGTPFIATVEIKDLNIRKGPGTNYGKTGKYTGKGKFTIVEVRSGQGSKKGWGLLLSYQKARNGWISLDYCKY